MRPMSAQDEQNEILESTKPKLVPKEEMQALLRESGKPSSSEAPLNLIDEVMQHHNLTREEAIEALDAFGF
jgi:hypothetical protein